jgi:2,5-diketo-D-gluconate reductase B
MKYRRGFRSPAAAFILPESSLEHLQTQGISLPRLGLGTFRYAGRYLPHRRSKRARARLPASRHREMYGNEEPIGAAIAASGIARKDLHVTTKVWNENLAPDASAGRSTASPEKLRLDHVVLYLVHWPAPRMNLPAMFEALMK